MENKDYFLRIKTSLLAKYARRIRKYLKKQSNKKMSLGFSKTAYQLVMENKDYFLRIKTSLLAKYARRIRKYLKKQSNKKNVPGFQ
jgi:hypothetical protein